MSSVRRVYVEKKPDFAVQAKELKHEISSYLGIKTVTAVHVYIRYDVENISEEVFEKACTCVFSEPPVDVLYKEQIPMAEGARVFSVEYLPGQFDQRADSAVQCVQFLKEDEQPIIKSATTYVIEGNITDEEFEAIKNHCINPVDSRETGMVKPETLITKFEEPEDVKIFDGFIDMEEAALKELYASLNLAMTFKDFQHIQNYFKNEEKRNPSMTEIRVLDTYWSDHCRHTTFSTELKNVTFKDGDYKEPIVKTYEQYLADREVLYKGRDDKFICLMDLALLAMKKLKSEGKLPQKKLVRGAAHGYSSYGNQIGLATGYVKEIYHPNYVAKRMEIGAVMGAAPRRAVKRENSDPGDIIILLGGRTGRDGIGGATGSSKVHTEASIEVCGAEVQKGNAPTERKIQRMFRREEVSKLIKKCNDFGAGGVSVAIGELAPGLQINLDKVPKKYAGLDGTEIAISESQERMAVVVDPKDVDEFMKYANEENLEAVVVAVVTEEPRLVLNWRGKEVVNISRAFLDTNGAHQETEVLVDIPNKEGNVLEREEKAPADTKAAWLSMLADLNTCSQKGLVEMFDGSIGAGSVFMPYGGKYQLTETQAMVAKVPVMNGKTDTVTMMSYGFDPYVSSWSPYHGAVYAVVESIARIVANGGDYSKIRFTFQEYFRRMTEDPERWSQPFAALLGAYAAQMGFGLPSIGGKDSMSGTFNDIDVPPTLVSFAVDVAKKQDIITPELKKAGSKLVWIRLPKDSYDLPDYAATMDQYGKLHQDILDGKVLSAYALDRHGIAAAVSKMAFGNQLGVKIEHNLDERDLFAPGFGDIICEVPADKVGELSVTYTVIGEVTDNAKFTYKDGMEISMKEALDAWTGTLEKVFKTKGTDNMEKVESPLYKADSIHVCKHKVARPTVFIPVFPGTNCEYDSAKAFERAGADVITRVFKNLTAEDIRDSVAIFEEAINQAQIIMFPGGFSAGDEPDGSAKFFATAFQNAKIKEAVTKLLNERDGLALGICNGFQALIKLGLVPYGEIVGQTADSPTLTYNTIGRHISKMVYTKVVTNKSPWLAQAELGKVYVNPASHGEGRFVANKEWIDKLFANGQVATQYCDLNGNVSMDEEWNVNGSYAAIEGITSPDGRVLGKMAHSERRGDAVAMNIYGEQDIKIFESGVAYFK